MRRASFVNRTWLSMVGIATAVTTTGAAWAPMTAAAPTVDADANTANAPTARAGDGTYESCAAYFGFGKRSDGVLDIVSFDVADDNGTDGVAHAVPTDTQVVLVLENAEGDQLQCAPVEVTEDMWNDAMDDLDLNAVGISPEHPLPSWPGPGHYIYPTVNFEPYITGSGTEPGTDFGVVTSVGFAVTSIPDGHTLVSPTGVQPLEVHYPGGGDGYTSVDDPLLRAYLTSAVGADAAAAFSGALLACGPDGSYSIDPSGDLLAAIRALETYRDYEHLDPEYLGCSDVRQLNGEVSFQLDLSDTVNYVEPIRLALPEQPTTTTTTTMPTTSTAIPTTTMPTTSTAMPTTTMPTTSTIASTTTATATTTSTTATTTTPPAARQAVAAEPVAATPAYTG